MDTALPQKFPFILDRNLAKANYTEDRVCKSCDIVTLANTANRYFGTARKAVLTTLVLLVK